MYRRHLTVAVLALSLVALSAAAAPPADTAGPPTADAWCTGWCTPLSTAWARIWSRWGPPGAGDVPPDAVPPSAGDARHDGGVGSTSAALTCTEHNPDDPSCEGFPDFDPDG